MAIGFSCESAWYVILLYCMLFSHMHLLTPRSYSVDWFQSHNQQLLNLQLTSARNDQVPAAQPGAPAPFAFQSSESERHYTRMFPVISRASVRASQDNNSVWRISQKFCSQTKQVQSSVLYGDHNVATEEAGL